MMPENPYDATLMIIVRQNGAIDQGEVLLSERPGREIIFPSEKGLKGPLDNARRGLREEMGLSVTEGVLLPLVASHYFKFAVDYEDMAGFGRVNAVLFQELHDDIVGIENGKDKFFWESMEKVMEKLSWNTSKFFWIIALTELLGQHKVSQDFYVAQFNDAPILAQTSYHT